MPIDLIALTSVPASLAVRPQWLLWRFKPHANPDKKPIKLPFYAGGGNRAGVQGSDEDRSKLVTLEAAIAAAQRVNSDGVGFAFLPGDGLIGIDIDGAIDLETGEVSERCQKIITSCNSYTEFSPSGRGVHIIVSGHTKTFKSNDIGLEVFCESQYFTFTGRRWPEAPADVAPLDAKVLARLQKTVDVAKGKGRVASAAIAVSENTDERAKIESALLHISPDCGYDDWVQIGMAIHAALGDGGFVVWDYWSSKSPKYVGDKDTRAHWKSFKPGGGITSATVYKMAMAGGWKPARAPRVRKPSPAPGADSPHIELPPLDDQGISTPSMPDGEKSVYADWTKEPWLQRTDKGALKPTLHNIEQFFSLHKSWADVFAYDEFAEMPMKVAASMWDGEETAFPADWKQIDHDRAAGWFSSRGMEVKDQSIAKAINIVAHRKPYNGPRDYLLGLKHDGVKRLQTWTIEYLGACTGAEHDSLEIEERDRVARFCELAGVKWMIGAVRRVLKPGVKMDNMLILEGDQGRMKSTVFKILGGDWFTDAPLELDGAGLKDSLMVLQGRWIIEIPEIESLNKASTGAIKRFLAQDTDLFRPPYGAMLKKAERRCAFGGTVNHDVYLKDDSGNRRFWPIKCWRDVDIERLRADRDQLWAEAVAMAQAGVKHWVEGQEEQRLFAIEQDKRYQSDAWEEPIIDYCKGRDRVKMGDLLLSALQMERSRWDKASQTRVGSVMRRMGWIRRRETDGAREGYYVRPDAVIRDQNAEEEAL